jgi:hypothetical protein
LLEVRNFAVEVKTELGGEVSDRAAIHSETYRRITNNLHCDRWFPYFGARTPMQHLEDYRMMQLEQRRREFEQKMEETRRDFELEMDGRQDARDTRVNRLVLALAGVGVLLTIVQVVAQVCVSPVVNVNVR